jgi:arylsulfatase/uncharacterized sulfatase
VPSARFLLLLLSLIATTPALAADRPNIVLLLADDWGFSDVGSFGGEIRTPNLDALASQGMRFANFHVSASCAPTRAMLLTGVDNHRAGVGNMPETMPLRHQGQPGYLGVLARDVQTLSSRLQDSGYHTYVAGKWHLGHEPHNLPPARGFERSLIQADSGSDNWEMRPYLLLKPKVAWYEEGETLEALPDNYYSSTFFVDKTIEYIDSNRNTGKPFFAYVAFQANHIPLQAPRHFIDNYRDRYNAGWLALREERHRRSIELGLIAADAPLGEVPGLTDWDSLSAEEQAYQARRMEVYAGMAEAMDHEVGRLMDYLRSIDAFDNTLFVFLSDNGAEASDPYATLSGRLWLDWQYDRSLERLGDKGAYSIIGPDWATAAASPLSTYKFYAGEGGLRVPMIIAGAEGISGGGITRAFSHVTDIAPTLLELAGVKTEVASGMQPMVGRSLLPVLRGESEHVYPADQPVGYELSGNTALFLGDYKLVKNLPPIGDNQWHLYNISSDPGETRDLRESEPELLKTMLAAHADYARENNVLPMPGNYDPITQVQINALVTAVIPLLLKPVLLTLALLAVLILVWRRMRRRPG